MISLKNTYLEIKETFNVRLNNLFEIELNFAFDLKDKIINKFQIEREEGEFQKSLQNFKNPSIIILRILSEKRFMIFKFKQNVKLKNFEFKSEFFEVSGIMPEIFIKNFKILVELMKWVKNILDLNNSDLKIEYNGKYELFELLFFVPKDIKKLEKILNKIFEIECKSFLKITELKWHNAEYLDYDTLKISLENLKSSKSTLELMNKFVQLINSNLFSDVEFYLKDNQAWISPSKDFKYNFVVPFNELFDDINKYIKFFGLFKNNKFINLIVNIIKSNEIKKYIKNYLPVFEKFENYLNEMNNFLKLLDL